MLNVFDLFYKVVDWFGVHVLTIRIFNISLLGWFIGVLMAIVIVTFVLSFKPRAVQIKNNNKNKE